MNVLLITTPTRRRIAEILAAGLESNGWDTQIMQASYFLLFNRIPLTLRRYDTDIILSFNASIISCLKMYRQRVALFLGGDVWLEDAYNLRLFRFRGRLWHAFNMLMKYRGIKDSDAVFCASEWLRRRVSSRCEEEKVFVLYFIFPEHHWNDVQEEHVEDLKHPSVAAIMDFDVYPQLIGFRPLRKLSQRFKGVNFFFAGDGRYLLLVKSWFQQCDNVTFLGHLPHSKVKGLLRQVDFVIHPAAYEGGIGGGVCEALLMAKPVVAWDVGGLPEIITDGKSGFLCHTLNDWEQAFHVLLDEKACRRFGQYGYRFIYDHFCEKKTIQQLMKNLKTL